MRKKIYEMRNAIISFLFWFLPLKKEYVIFEAFPNFNGSPWLIYQEFICRKIAKKYKFVWAVNSSEKMLQGVRCEILVGKMSLKQKIRALYILSKAKLIIDSNRYVRKRNPKTYRLYTQHAAPLKRAFEYTFGLGSVEAVLSLSSEMALYEKEIFPTAKGNFVVLGYPSNDDLFKSVDLYENSFWSIVAKTEFKFNKIIGWMPTYRQHRNGGTLGSNYVFPYGVPLFQKIEEFEKVNAFLKDKNILLAVQMHHAQADNFPKQIYSNIVLIPPALKQEVGISNANLMSNFDAMITDYSGAYHEYLLLNRPIALSIDDYDEYAKNPGFSIDYFDLIKGVYLRDTSDLIHFIEDVANGVDSAKEEREKSLRRIHKYTDGQSTKRVVDFLIEKAKL